MAESNLSSPRSAVPLIGRVPEMGRLRALLVDAQRGKGRTAVLSGVAGVGKSRLLSELLREAASRGFATLEARCFEPERLVAGSLISDLLDSWPVPVNVASTSRPDTGDGNHVAIPGIAAGIDGESGAFHRGFRRLVAELAAQRPVVLAVDDLHWADDFSLVALQYLALRAEPLRVLLVLSYEPDQATDGARRVLADLNRARACSLFPLAGLNREEVGRFIRETRGPSSLAFADRIFSLSDGIPFFVEELLAASGVDAAGDELHLPPSLQEAVAQSLDPLSPNARQVATLASVVGRRFDFELLAALTGLERVQLIDLVRGLVEAGVLRSHLPRTSLD